MCTSCDKTADETAFGADAWVYCHSHVGVHSTGWCTVGLRNKILLKSKTREEAIAEARAKGLQTYYNS